MRHTKIYISLGSQNKIITYILFMAVSITYIM
jgi:hypothetical protein